MNLDTPKAHILEVFSTRLREARHHQAMTQAALAEAAGLHAIYVTRLERGQQNPTLDVVVRLACALEVPVAALVPRTGPRPRPGPPTARATARSRKGRR
jgi:transcriptional regulator with XRE-family HTH domain